MFGQLGGDFTCMADFQSVIQFRIAPAINPEAHRLSRKSGDAVRDLNPLSFRRCFHGLGGYSRASVTPTASKLVRHFRRSSGLLTRARFWCGRDEYEHRLNRVKRICHISSSTAMSWNFVMSGLNMKGTSISFPPLRCLHTRRLIWCGSWDCFSSPLFGL